MKRHPEWFIIVMTALALFGIVACIIVLHVIATGGTFGARCDRAYPNDGLASERCVDRLSRGEPL